VSCRSKPAASTNLYARGCRRLDTGSNGFIGLTCFRQPNPSVRHEPPKLILRTDQVSSAQAIAASVNAESEQVLVTAQLSVRAVGARFIPARSLTSPRFASAQ